MVGVTTFLTMAYILALQPMILAKGGFDAGSVFTATIIATAIASIMNNQEIIVFGKTGTIRDYIYVTDITNGIIAALEHGKPGECYNIGSGVGRSNQDILDALYPFAESAGLEPKVNRLPLRKFDVPINVLDSTKIIKETGWGKNVSFKDGIEKTWNWYYHKILFNR